MKRGEKKKRNVITEGCDFRSREKRVDITEEMF